MQYDFSQFEVERWDGGRILWLDDDETLIDPSDNSVIIGPVKVEIRLVDGAPVIVRLIPV